MRCLLLALSLLILLLAIGAGLWPIQHRIEGWPQGVHFPPHDSDDSSKNWFHLVVATNSSVVLRSDALAVSDQAIYSGTEAGEIMYLDRTTEDLHILIDLKNHFPRASPIGLALAKQNPDVLYVADAENGILQVDGQGNMQVLLSADQLGYPNDILVSARNPSILYFTDSTTHAQSGLSPWQVFMQEYFQYRPTGKVYRYNTATKDLTLLMDNLWFPKGLVLDETESVLLVSNSLQRNIIAIPLMDGATGFSYVVENLPFHPAGMTRVNNSSFLVTSIIPRQNQLETHVQPHPVMKKLMLQLPSEYLEWWFVFSEYARVYSFDGSPELTFTHLTPSAEGGSSVTSAVIEDGKLFVGSLHSPELKFSPWNI